MRFLFGWAIQDTTLHTLNRAYCSIRVGFYSTLHVYVFFLVNITFLNYEIRYPSLYAFICVLFSAYGVSVEYLRHLFFHMYNTSHIQLPNIVLNAFTFNFLPSPALLPQDTHNTTMERKQPHSVSIFGTFSGVTMLK